ncbi:MAG: heavy-metal-associated domain-containing protein [Deltaproteobacteria bacterium]|nr:heavy-metal-associated domain-containing protein [Deltaproteobacteria bacterium]
MIRSSSTLLSSAFDSRAAAAAALPTPTPRPPPPGGAGADVAAARPRLGIAVVLGLALAAACADKPVPPPVPQDPTRSITIAVAGMHCDGCAGTVTEALKLLDGVLEARVSLADKQAVVRYDPARVKPEELALAITKAGYKPTLAAVEPLTPAPEAK